MLPFPFDEPLKECCISQNIASNSLVAIIEAIGVDAEQAEEVGESLDELTCKEKVRCPHAITSSYFNTTVLLKQFPGNVSSRYSLINVAYTSKHHQSLPSCVT
jgi:hypothetical protein